MLVKPTAAHLPGAIIHQQIQRVIVYSGHHGIVQVIACFDLANPRITLFCQLFDRSATLLTHQIDLPGVLAERLFHRGVITPHGIELMHRIGLIHHFIINNRHRWGVGFWCLRFPAGHHGQLYRQSGGNGGHQCPAAGGKQYGGKKAHNGKAFALRFRRQNFSCGEAQMARRYLR